MEFALTYLSCPERQLTEYLQLINESVRRFPMSLHSQLKPIRIDSPSSKTCLAECSAVLQQLRQWSEFSQSGLIIRPHRARMTDQLSG